MRSGPGHALRDSVQHRSAVQQRDAVGDEDGERGGVRGGEGLARLGFVQNLFKIDLQGLLCGLVVDIRYIMFAI